MSLSRIRAALAKSGTFESVDGDGNVRAGDEAVAYYRGQEFAERAIELLRRGRVLLPNLEGFHETQDIEFKQALRDIANSLKITPKVVYNPGCGHHVSLATTFQEARAIFVDPDLEAVHELRQEGFEVYPEDMNKFVLPDGLKADITLILNAGYLLEEKLDEIVADEGVVLINNWHLGAEYMIDNCPNYRLLRDMNSDQNVYSAKGSLDDANTLYVFQRAN